ncbi:MAG TPA: nucleolar RNA-binding Nop10p family protein [Candidatus Bilamarchaeaceae archaeon]|nr:nucleolar RNA-binding Nop10p family protein [Candidatus Bilamarchaeaceae archaeon]
MKRVKRCSVCGQYTLERKHCGNMAGSAHPAPFNPNDPRGHYRRKAYGIEE